MADNHDDDLYLDDRHDQVYDRNDSHDASDSYTRSSLETSSTSGTTDTTDTTPDLGYEDESNNNGDNSRDSNNNGTRQIGRAVTTHGRAISTTSQRVDSPSPRQRPRDSQMGSRHLRNHSGFKNDIPSTPPSRRTSIRSSRLSTPTTFVPSKKDRVRYSWQSLHDDDESGKPRIHVIKIVSTASTASAGIGQEEAFGFSCSSGGKRIAVYNSARLFVLQTAALPVNVSQEYSLKRRPLAVEIIDDENILAVLADEHTVNVYNVSHQRVRRIRTIRPDHPTYTIALSRTGALLAAAYEGGIEIFALSPTALSTDRRAIRSPRMDKLQFSDDGSALLGTTTRLHASSSVVVSVPVYPAAADDIPTHEELKEAWCSGILNPENIRNSSHATFWREDGLLSNEKIFAWNGLEDTFGILTTANFEYNNIACPIGVSQPLSAVGGLGAAVHSAPAVDESGCSVAMIVNQTTVRIYTIPQNVPEDENSVEAHSLDHELNEEYGCPFAEVRWVHTHKSIAPPKHAEPRTRGRLIVTSPGGVFDSDTAEQNVQDVEGGRIIIFDFDPQYAGQPGQIFTFTLGKAPPQPLDEEALDHATEIDLVRRRTITQNRGGTLGQRPPTLGRTATSMSRRRDADSREATVQSPDLSARSSSIQNTPTQEHPPNLLFSHLRGPRRASLSLNSLSSEASRSLPDLLEATELAYEEPYTQGAPRSGPAIQRAATIANRHRYQALEERETEVTDPEGVPLPTYSEYANQPLPSKYRKLAGLDIPQSGRFLNNLGPMTAPPAMTDYQAPQGRDYHGGTAMSTRPSPAPSGAYHSYTATRGVSPIGSDTPSSTTGNWENISPVMNRAPTFTTPGLRHQPSWETVTTRQGGTYASSDNYSSLQTFSPISRTDTRTTLRSIRSFDSQSPPMHGSSYNSPNQLSLPPLPFARTQPATQIQPSAQHEEAQDSSSSDVVNLDLDFRHSMLIPLDSLPSSSTEPFSLSSMTPTSHYTAGSLDVHDDNIASSPAAREVNAYYSSRSYSNRQTPFQRASQASAHARNLLSRPSAESPDSPNSTATTSSPGAGYFSEAVTAAYQPRFPSATTVSPPTPSRSTSRDSRREAEKNRATSMLQRPDPNIRAHSAPLVRTDTDETTATVTAAPRVSGLGPGGQGARPAYSVMISSSGRPGLRNAKTSFGSGKGVGISFRGRPSVFRSKSVGAGEKLFGKKGKGVAVDEENGRDVKDDAGRGHVWDGSGQARDGGRATYTREEFREIEGQGKRCVVM